MTPNENTLMTSNTYTPEPEVTTAVLTIITSDQEANLNTDVIIIQSVN